MSARLLIWSNKHGGAWFRPKSAGYTINSALAGRFDEEEARSICEPSRGECTYHDENSIVVADKAYEYLEQKRREIRPRLETLTPEQMVIVMAKLLQERIDMHSRGEI